MLTAQATLQSVAPEYGMMTKTRDRALDLRKMVEFPIVSLVMFPEMTFIIQ